MTISNSPIRYNFINNKILSFYKKHNILKFPITINKLINVINQYPNCKVLSYSHFMKIHNCTLQEVILFCDSKSGCTHYDKINDRYLILYNDLPDNNNVEGRILWTLAHEIGHILSAHFLLIKENMIADNSIASSVNVLLEQEADYFTATFLAPFQLFKTLNINSPIDIQKTFGLSVQASIYRWDKYLKWKQNHIKTAFDNDIIKVISNQNL